MNKSSLLLLPFFLLIVLVSDAQYHSNHSIESNSYDQVSLGFGFGLDYGGFGGNLTVYPQKNIGLFASGGYALAGFGYNVGVKARILPDHGQASPYFVAMYGYNAAVVVVNEQGFNKLYYGPSIGAGVDIWANRSRKGYLSLALLVPFRSPDVQNYIDYLRNSQGIDFKNNLIPIALSIGYKFVLD
ncbi:MAG TPA: hypothetical protein VGM41_18435 [Chitinophagaceae bacterium]|jgi:hypothetical protein